MTSPNSFSSAPLHQIWLACHSIWSCHATLLVKETWTHHWARLYPLGNPCDCASQSPKPSSKKATHSKSKCVISTTFLDCSSCISVINVTKECYWIGFVKVQWEASYIIHAVSFQKTYLAAFLAFLPQPWQQRNGMDRCSTSKKPHQKCWFIGFLTKRSFSRFEL